MSDSTSQALSLKDQGNNLFSGGRFEEALVKYKEAIALDNKQPVFYSNASQCLLNLKRYQEALDYASSALKLDNIHVKSLVRRASAFRALSRFNEASQDLQLASKLEPTNKNISSELSSVLSALEIQPSSHSIPPSSTSSQSSTKKVKFSALHEAQVALENLVPDVPPPANSFGDFEVHWRSLRGHNDLMHNYLVQFDPSKIPYIFKDLMKTEMLESWLVTVLRLVNLETPVAAPSPLSILESLSSLPKFDLMIMFLTPNQLNLVKEVFLALDQNGIESGHIKPKFM